MSEPTLEMPAYRSHKIVRALEIAMVTQFDDIRELTFCDVGFHGVVVKCDADMFARYVPVPGDYYVVYEDGYKSFSPRRAFQDGYSLAA